MLIVRRNELAACRIDEIAAQECAKCRRLHAPFVVCLIGQLLSSGDQVIPCPICGWIFDTGLVKAGFVVGEDKALAIAGQAIHLAIFTTTVEITVTPAILG